MTGKELNLDDPNVKALTIHSCKGLEFPIIAIPFVEKDILPRKLEDDRSDAWRNISSRSGGFYLSPARVMRYLL